MSVFNPSGFYHYGMLTKIQAGSNSLPAVRIKLNGFDLTAALERDHKARMAAEDAEESFLVEDEYDFEDEELTTADLGPTPLASKTPPSVINPPSLDPSSRKERRKQDKASKSRLKRATNSAQRNVECGLKPRAVFNAQAADYIDLPAFDHASLPVSSTGWSGNPRIKLSPGLQRVWKDLSLLVGPEGFKYIAWDGCTPAVLLDKHDRIVVVLGGIPPATVDSDSDAGRKWRSDLNNATEAIKACREKSTFAKKELGSRRGEFAQRTTGYGYGNGRQRPLNFKISGKKNKAAMEELLQSPGMRRISGFANSLFNCYAHKIYKEYYEANQECLQHHPGLRCNFPNTVFAALSVNMGPRSFSPPHMDADNLACGWCSDTALGPFDPDKGGQLVLWDLRVVIRFPPGSTVLFPSALITHSTLPIQAQEERYAVLQYSSGGLFRWRNNGWRSDKSFLANASAGQLKEREAARAHRWQFDLQKFTRWSDLVQGDWKGMRRTEAGLDGLSDLSDAEQPPTKRSCH